MTKAQRIRELYAKGYTPPEIAKIVGCLDSYARVCARQRVGGSQCSADVKYSRAVYEKGDREKARKASRAAYGRVRELGKSTHEAEAAGFRAYRDSMNRTGRAARRAEAQS